MRNKLIVFLVWLFVGLIAVQGFSQGYQTYPPIADKVLLPDGSIVSIVQATTVAPASAARAQQYQTMPVSAAKYLMPDGSIINGIPIVTIVTGTPTAGTCIKVATLGGLEYGTCGSGGGSVSDTAYDATTWDNVTDVAPSKNAVRD